jgi:oxygen-independent coproporphyrinogen III oxidase
MRGEIIERIMCDFHADIGQICERYRQTPDRVLGSSARLKDLITAGVATLRGSSIRVGSDARFLVRNVAATFDDYLDASSALHSRAV